MNPRLCSISFRGAAFAVLCVSISSAQTRLFITEYQFNNPKIRAIDLDGSNLHELFTIPAAEWLPVGLTYDPATDKLYWVDSASPNNVLSAKSDGTSYASLVNVPGSSARGPSLDGAGRMYYSGGNQILRANLNGSSPQVLFTAILSDPLGAPCVDGTNGHVYFGADGQIKRMNLDGSGVKTVVRGVLTPRAIEVDVEHGHVYWIDANTISDFVGRAKLDGSEFTVLIDNSPGVVQSSGLLAFAFDSVNDQLYYADELAGVVTRANLDGTGAVPFYSSPVNLSPSGLALSTGAPLQVVADCNGNAIADAIDISAGSATDCDDNGVPDECQSGDPCHPPPFHLDQGSNPVATSRTVGGPSASPGSQFEVFQPFDVPAGGWTINGIELDGWTANYADGAGFTATLFPDNGSGTFANESAPIAARVYNFRFDPDRTVWVEASWQQALAAGRYWLRLRATNPPTYHGAANLGTSGLGSISRSGLGNLFAAGPIAMRITDNSPPLVYCTAGTTTNGCNAVISATGTPSASASSGFAIQVSGVEGQKQGILFYGITGPIAATWGSGSSYLCVKSPTQRTGSQGSGGTAGTCNGALALDWNAYLNANPGALGNPFTAGDTVCAQGWFRDPPAPKTTSLSNALRFTVAP
jgi:hypothetical protein